MISGFPFSISATESETMETGLRYVKNESEKTNSIVSYSSEIRGVALFSTIIKWNWFLKSDKNFAAMNEHLIS